MRHSQAGLAIPDIPFVYGHLFPPFNSAELASINALCTMSNLPPVSLGQIWIHFAHRVGALVVTAAIAMTATHILRTFKGNRKVREPALILLGLVLVQVLPGLLTVTTGKDPLVATSHVAVGALLLASSVVLTVRAYGLYRAPWSRSRLALVEGTSVLVIRPDHLSVSTTTEQGGSWTRSFAPSRCAPLNSAGLTRFGSSNVL